MRGLWHGDVGRRKTEVKIRLPIQEVKGKKGKAEQTFAGNLKERKKKKKLLSFIYTVFALSPNSWSSLETNGLSDVPALSDIPAV